MRAIFISYRREDSEGQAGRLFEDLTERFGERAVFMDVAGIEPGRDFRRVIEQQVASCGVLLALIGKDWLTAADEHGRRRLDDVADFVRLETASALKRDIPVIPVLVRDAAMPRAEQLPDELKDLAYRNGVELTHARWASDVKLLIAALMPYVDAAPSAPEPGPTVPPPPSTPTPSRKLWWLLLPTAALAVGGVAYALRDRAAPAAPLRTAEPAASAAPATAPPAAVVAAASVPKPVAVAPPAPTPVAGKPVDKPPAVVRKAPPAASAPMPSPIAPAPAIVAVAPPSAEPAPAPARPIAVATGPEVVATARDPSLDLLGSAATLAMATRTIVIRPETSYVNVTGGEIIRFDVGNKSFVWNFNGRPSSFDLARIAPGLLDRKVTAYVAPNPMYPRRN